MSRQVFMVVQALEGGTAMALAILVAVVFGTSVQASSRKQSQVLLTAIALVIAAWFGVTSAIAAVGDFSVAGGQLALPLLGLSVLIPVVVGVAAPLVAAPVRRVISQGAIQPTVIAVHSLRVIPGVVFLSMIVVGVLPAIFAVPAGAGDVIVGLAAFSASRWLRSGRWDRVLAWNLLGVLDLVTAIVLAVLTTPGQLHLISATPDTRWMNMPPLVVVPTFEVAIYLLLHSVSLRFVIGARRQARTAAAPRLDASA
jgi:hypothetical protein